MASSKIVLPSVVLALRLLALGLLAGSMVLIVTNRVNVQSDLLINNVTLTFKDVYSYRYVLGIAVAGCVYTLLQIPLAVVAIATRKRVVGGKANVALLLICADVVFALAFATGAGAGFGLSYDRKRSFQNPQVPDGLTKAEADVFKLIYREFERFYVRGYTPAALMLVAANCMAAVIMISVYAIVKY